MPARGEMHALGPGFWERTWFWRGAETGSHLRVIMIMRVTDISNIQLRCVRWTFIKFIKHLWGKPSGESVRSFVQAA